MNRLLGIVPLALFCVYAYVALREDRPADILWMCHVANAMLGVGLLLDIPLLVRIAVPCAIAGLPLWVFELWIEGSKTWLSAATHAGSVAIGLIALRRIRMPGNPWLYGILLFVAIQQICRLWTPPALNVNLAHRIHESSTGLFDRYGSYWLFTTLSGAAALWAIGRVLMLAFPPPERSR